MGDRKEHRKEVQSLVANVGNTLHGKDVDVIVPALTYLLAEVALQGGHEYEDVIRFVLGAITQYYEENSISPDETIH